MRKNKLPTVLPKVPLLAQSPSSVIPIQKIFGKGISSKKI